MKVCITKTLKSDNGKEFKAGNQIHFILNRNDKAYSCFGTIDSIEETNFLLINAQVDGKDINIPLYIPFSEVDQGIINFEDTGYY